MTFDNGRREILTNDYTEQIPGEVRRIIERVYLGSRVLETTVFLRRGEELESVARNLWKRQQDADQMPVNAVGTNLDFARFDAIPKLTDGFEYVTKLLEAIYCQRQCRQVAST